MSGVEAAEQGARAKMEITRCDEQGGADGDANAGSVARRHSSFRWWEDGTTVGGMTVRKLSVALDDAVAEAAAEAAARSGLSLSAWLNRAAENELAIGRGLAAVGECEADHGALTAAELAAADKVLDSVLAGAARRAG